MDADFSDGSCTYASFPYDCNDECVNDVDGDGVCDELKTPDARTLRHATEALATDDDGSCLFLDALGECGGS